MADRSGLTPRASNTKSRVPAYLANSHSQTTNTESLSMPSEAPQQGCLSACSSSKVNTGHSTGQQPQGYMHQMGKALSNIPVKLGLMSLSPVLLHHAECLTHSLPLLRKHLPTLGPKVSKRWLRTIDNRN
jgi:hypothetical protein